MEYLKLIEKKIKEMKSEINNQDYHNIWIVVNNQVRAKQVLDSIRREMLSKNYKVISPPQVMTYDLAFLYLAAEICLGIYNRNKITEYSEEWVDLLNYKVVHKYTQDKKDNKLSRELLNLIALLGKDARFLIRNIVLYLGDIEGLKGDTSNVESVLKGVYNQYKEEIKNHDYNSTQTFLNSLQGYLALYNKLENGGSFDFNTKNLPEIMFIEDYEDLEPLFQKITEKLEELKKFEILKTKIEKINKFDSTNYSDNYTICAYINTLDEAEAIVYKIKEFLKEGKPAENFGIVACTNEIYDLLVLTFHRYGILLDKLTPLYLSEPYLTVLSFIKILFKYKYQNIRISEEDIENIFNHECSKFFIEDTNFYTKFYGELLIKGPRFYNDPKNVISEVKEKLKNEQNITKIESFLEVFDKLSRKLDQSNDDIILNVVNKVLDYDKIYGTSLRTQFFSAIEEANKVLNELKDIVKDKSFYEVCFDVLSIASKKQYIDRKQKTEDYEHFIPIVTAEKADNITAKEYLFVCGLDGNFDKQIFSYIPESLVREINEKTNGKKLNEKIPGLEEETQKIYDKLKNAISKSQNVFLTFSYYDLTNKEKGISNFINLYKKENQKLGEFKKGYESSADNITKSETTKSKENKNNELGEILSLLDDIKKIKVEDLFKKYLEIKKRPFDNNTIELNVKYELGTFIYCPREFLFDIIGEVTGVKKVEVKTKEILRGEFWHKVFENAAKKEGFNSDNENDIFECLEKSFNDLLQTKEYNLQTKKYNLDEFETFYGNNTEVIKNIVLSTFAENEAKRRKKGYKTIEVESEKTVEVNKEFKNGDKTTQYIFKLTGKIDRIDKTNDGQIAIIDYKIKEKNYKVKFLTSSKEKNGEYCFELDNKIIQLCLYAYIYAYIYKKYMYEKYQKELSVSPILSQIQCGILNILGEEEIKNFVYGNSKDIMKFSKEVEKLIDKSLDKFCEFLSINLSAAISFQNGIVNRSYDIDSIIGICKYCTYKDICLSLTIKES